MKAEDVPARIRLAVQLLTTAETDRVLEIGCGNGIASRHLASMAAFKALLAIDRSPTAIAAARSALAASGLDAARCRRIEFRLAQLAGLNPGPHRFDKAFAVNVNLFWLQAQRELVTLRQCLARDGHLLLFYQPPVVTKTRRIVAGCQAQLAEEGFTVLDVREERAQEIPFVAIAARPGHTG